MTPEFVAIFKSNKTQMKHLMNKETIQTLIKTGLPEAHVVVLGDDGQHFEAVVISDTFIGKRLLQRHQQVYACLGEKMGNEIHALRLSTLTPEEAENTDQAQN